MPIPVLVWAIAIAAAAVAAAAAAAGVLSRAKGKSIALLGPKRAGKTSWRTFLEHGSIPAGYEHTTLTEKLSTQIRLQDLDLHVEVCDLSGSDDAVDSWHQAAKESDYVFYFIDGTRLGDEAYRRRARDYARVVASWEDSTSPVTLVVSHADQVPEWPQNSDEIRTSPHVAELRHLVGARKTIVADLGSTDGCRKFTLDALSDLEDK
jgi:GTPase SAR1 family protein